MLYHKLKELHKKARKEKNELLLNILTIVLGEIQRSEFKTSDHNDIPDAIIVNAIFKLLKDMKKNKKYIEAYEEKKKILEDLIPDEYKDISEDDLIMWITTNIPEPYNMSTIGVVKKTHPLGQFLDGNFVKACVMKLMEEKQ